MGCLAPVPTTHRRGTSRGELSRARGGISEVEGPLGSRTLTLPSQKKKLRLQEVSLWPQATKIQWLARAQNLAAPVTLSPPREADLSLTWGGGGGAPCLQTL